MNGSWVVQFLENCCFDERCVFSHSDHSVTLGKIALGDQERNQGWDERFLFRSPQQEDKQLIFNLSTKGALAAGAKPAQVGQPLFLVVTLPDRLAELKLAGKVRWVKKVGRSEGGLYLTGIQFEEQDEATAGTLKTYLQFLQRDRIIQRSKSLAIEDLEKLIDLSQGCF